ncbi:NAD(P)/FAD-dependent oxidoreductase [Sphingosinicella ginsenosidimutans]|uniref:FAD-binding oxidoreductase n=1 Tax=Allosphingosinicella ginsenosidimutans TaxID=1176539 RepID=A0A5C6TRC1_9SPHN|nr:FAD-binding oxidoreductase [Sphingosinicella ginsenosidimutans]TXC62551.1 FAD-binding oxidoreductase [Sphingosinicella ginsenosidimutans]
MSIVDFLVVGGGIAGASMAAELSGSASVLLLEAEAQPNYHSTGRSAAIFFEMYGKPPVRALSRASKPLFFHPPGDFADAPLVGARGALYIANKEQLERLEAFAGQPDIRRFARRLSAEDARALCPVLRPDYVAGGLEEPGAADIDVHGLHQAYLRRLKLNGGTLLTSKRVEAIRRDGDAWVVSAGAESFEGRILVNAAGAWGDEIARLAGVAPLGLEPRRRTAALVDPPADAGPIAGWPLVIDIDEQFYFKPDAGLVLLSPADETLVEPCDIQPEEWDIALAVDRVGKAADIPVRHIRHSWAGLRTFSPDRVPVCGFDGVVPGFFWLVGQGGYGVQTAPGMARLGAALAQGAPLCDSLLANEVDPADFSPRRFEGRRQG